ncbi:syntenin-1-like [Antechinus flavipes]|uniref:syntenin-1-like n=1 Tax=Antechinus flavipes TaxID=38775 RepID=UPI002235D03B|nr:syntenin-1-like [Antechinus flavipes]
MAENLLCSKGRGGLFIPSWWVPYSNISSLVLQSCLNLHFFNSPASLVGLRFGDQVLQINGENCAGWSSDKAHKVLKQAFGEKITMTIRDRPFERTITMHKDSTGHVGFIFKNGKITSIVKDSSAARNGLLTEHNICEINGQNVIGLKDSQVADILSTSGTVVTITIMPAFIFEHIIKRMASSVMKNLIV